ncbi:MAG: AbrB/MazE/SpoVT family DNA-binding domain-containing protein [Deinococcota bacterium]|jgi:AbrB family looped-hinge helix DNA binding protein|nr:AbrB/MazE/SpoVT family DNA-binding domain-containing protein [Deinococcota bacterium]
MSIGTVKLGSNGRLVIPAQYRKALGVGEGDELVMRLEEGELRLSTRKIALKRAQERVRRYVPEGVSLAGELIDERLEEAAKE